MIEKEPPPNRPFAEERPSLGTAIYMRIECARKLRESEILGRRVCVCAYVLACVRACVRVYVRARVRSEDGVFVPS